jgi:hypothetical protein
MRAVKGRRISSSSRAGQPDVAAIAGNIGEQRRDGAARQAFLGATALCPEPVQRSDRRRSRHISGAGDGEIGDHMRQQRPVDELAGQVGMAHGRADRPEPVGRVRQSDVGSGAAEVAERDHTPGGQTGLGLHRGQRGRGVRDQCQPFGGGRPFGQ